MIHYNKTMTRDNQIKKSKKEMTSKRSKRLEELNRRKKKADHSDSDSNDHSSDSEEEEMDVHEYRKFISKIFPSKYINKKIRTSEKLKKVLEEDSASEEEEVKPKKNKNKRSNKKNKKVLLTDSESEEEERQTVSKKYNKNKTKVSKKINVSDDEDEISLGEEDTEDDNSEYNTEESEWETIDEEDEEEKDIYKKPGKGKVNIIFTIGGINDDEDEEEWEDEEYDSDYDENNDDTEDEDEEVSTDEDSDHDAASEHDEESEKKINKKPSKNLNKINNKEEEEDKKTRENHTKDTKSSETLENLRKLLQDNPKDKSIQKCIDVYEKEMKLQKTKLEKKKKKQKAKNMRIFKKIIKDKNTMNDFSFYEKLEPESQNKIIKELKEINKITRIEKPYRMTLLESTIPVHFKSAAMKKINSLRYMEPGSGEFYKSKNWVDTFMRIPFNKIEGLPISIDNGVDKCHEFMENAQKTLDQAVYGLNDAKMQIMQMLGQLLTNPKAIGAAIAIHGPPGTGKTSLVKEGISKILNRPFAFIALGGATDSSFLEGHGYTYEGSTWGKIVQILIDSKCMNPVIYFDELDKISDTPRGEEIAGILTHLTDTSQNSQFHDKYFAEIDFDLSKCLFIFSYNDESKINPILKDRMYRIKTKGYIPKEKTIIANNYLLPRICEQVRFNEDQIIIPNDVIGHIIDTLCNKEDGVRNLKRCLEIIYTKLNLYRLMKPGSNLFEGEMSLTVEFPFHVTKEIVDKLIKREGEDERSALWRNLYN